MAQHEEAPRLIAEGDWYVGQACGKTVRLPRVTAVIKPLVNYGAIPPEVLECKGAIGVSIHEMIFLHETGMLNENSLHPDEPGQTDITPVLNAWKKCKARHSIKVKTTERLVVSCRHQYAGRLDQVALVGGVPSIIDIKTRRYHPVLDPLQTAAYMEAWNEMNRSDCVRHRYVCELFLDGSFHLQLIKGQEHFNIFKSALAAWTWKEANK